jgi:uncharacterized membrane protein (UPF0127 family)
MDTTTKVDMLHVTYIEFSLTRNQRSISPKKKKIKGLMLRQNMLASNSLLFQQSQELDKHIKLN